MKKVLLLSLIIVAVVTVAFTTQTKPPSFVVATGQLHDYLESQQALLSESNSSQDSADILSNTQTAAHEFANEWDIDDELSRSPVFPYAFACEYQCALNYAKCNKEFGPQTPTPFCWSEYQYCISHCTH